MGIKKRSGEPERLGVNVNCHLTNQEGKLMTFHCLLQSGR